MTAADDSPPSGEDADAARFVRYQFTPSFLKLKTVGAMYVIEFLHQYMRWHLSRLSVYVFLASLTTG